MKENTREISILKTRILEYLEFKKVSKYECYKNTGITNGVLSQPNGLSEENLMRFLSYYTDISYCWFFTGNGLMIKPNASDNINIGNTLVSNDEDTKKNDISQTENSYLYQIILDEKAEKENIRLENQELSKKIIRLEERIRQLESRHSTNEVAEAFTDKSSSDYGEDSLPTKQPPVSKILPAGKA